MKQKQFIDKDKRENLVDGIEYFAVGLISEEFPDSLSGKELVVEYIDPWGRFQREWRARSEVTLYEISDEDAQTLRVAFERIQQLS